MTSSHGFDKKKKYRESILCILKANEGVFLDIRKLFGKFYKTKNSCYLVPVVDFDDKLFTVSNSTSYRSKMKVKLFQEINSDINGFVIRAKRSNLDKLYKVVELNLDIIKLG